MRDLKREVQQHNKQDDKTSGKEDALNEHDTNLLAHFSQACQSAVLRCYRHLLTGQGHDKLLGHSGLDVVAVCVEVPVHKSKLKV